MSIKDQDYRTAISGYYQHEMYCPTCGSHWQTVEDCQKCGVNHTQYACPPLTCFDLSEMD
jgi:predicted RNA-binding Zn-ribbon protein involved in translation (DUF1610 family)